MLVAIIIAAEVAFWLFIAAGLVARYPLGMRRTGGVMLALSPAVDLVVLTAAVLDLRDGGTAAVPHALAAVYIGVSVGFGHQMIRWADAKFAHRFAGGPAPARKPTGGRARARYEAVQFGRHLLAWTVGVALLGGAVLLVGDLDQTEALVSMAEVWTVVLVIDGLITLGDWQRFARPAAQGCSAARPDKSLTG